MARKLEHLDRYESRGVELEEGVVAVNRCATVVKGGRRFSFSAMVVVGDRDGTVGFGFGKAKDVPSCIEKAVADGRKNLCRLPIVGTTLPHSSEVRYCATRVRLMPARPGTGIVASSPVRLVLELAGYRDVLTKVYGSTNPINMVKATLKCLQELRTRAQIEKARGVELT